MSTLSTFIKYFRQAVAVLLLPWLAWSCQMVTDGDYDDEIEASSTPDYINITISVSASNSPVTRAYPSGGEYGDGSEKGIEERENEVNNITLIFYEDEDGINTNSDNAKVVCVKTYDVHRYNNDDLPNSHTHKPGESEEFTDMEVLYTTGDQELIGTTLEKEKTYKVIVVANADINVEVGNKIKDVREKVLTTVYNNVNGVGINASNFVMASESDATVELKNPRFLSSNSILNKDRYVYYFQCIHIERLAARIDFWAKNSEGYKTKKANNEDYTIPGYEYKVKDANGNATQDRFVLTRITPFNLNNGDEYVLKRSTTDFITGGGFSSDPAITYLADEVASDDGANWVLDPNTWRPSTNTSTPIKDNSDNKYTNYVSKLSSITETFANSYTVSMQSEQENKFAVSGNDNIIISYTKENTLIPGISPLYYHATGLAFEGYYYENGTGEGERRVYYYFIRHQGENEEDTAYDAFTNDNINDAKKVTCPLNPVMNYGIVRNNIYRVSIENISSDANNITLHIKVKKWDKFVHEPIYM